MAQYNLKRLGLAAVTMLLGIGLAFAASISRLMRATMLEVNREDLFVPREAKGFPSEPSLRLTRPATRCSW